MSTILIVDDDRATTSLLKTLFQLEGFQSITCPDPDRVLTVAQQNQPVLIFLDFHLAEQESLSILIELKADAELRNIPVVMSSGLDYSEKCLAAGADGFIPKPFRPANLMQKVRDLLEKKPDA